MIESSSFWVGTPSEPDTYQLINTLGTGGEGQVWRAVVPLSDAGRRQVAVKILSADNWMNDQEWSRFGHLLKSLSHPGLVRVSEVFAGPVMHRYQQTPPPGAVRYVVMDFVDGITLTEWLAENPDSTVAARIAILRTVAAALDEMHSGRTTEVPVAHGDVKPANIILKPDGGTVLVDLGPRATVRCGRRLRAHQSLRRSRTPRGQRPGHARIRCVRVLRNPGAPAHRATATARRPWHPRPPGPEQPPDHEPAHPTSSGPRQADHDGPRSPTGHATSATQRMDRGDRRQRVPGHQQRIGGRSLRAADAPSAFRCRGRGPDAAPDCFRGRRPQRRRPRRPSPSGVAPWCRFWWFWELSWPP